MTDNRTTELLPCPFCGDSYEKDDEDYFYSANHKPWCPLRGTSYGGYGMTVADYDEDIAAWNTRADDYKQAAEYWQRMYERTFAERTCRDTGENEWHFVCSACGYEQNGYECWNYCPNCGARRDDYE